MTELEKQRSDQVGATFEIREAVAADAGNLAVLSIQVWLDTYALEGINDVVSDFVLTQFTTDKLRALVEQPGMDLLVAVAGDSLVGYIAVNQQAQSEQGDYGFEIDTFYIQRRYQGKGLGRRLLAEVRQRFGDRFWLTTWVYNDPAIAFYQRYGFVDKGQAWFELDGELHENRVLVFNY